MTTTISAAENPALANNLVQQAMAQAPAAPADVQILLPSDNIVMLPGGFLTPTGDIVHEAEVRELNGNDEEAISRANSMGRAILTVLQRGTVRVGNQKVTEEILDKMLTGDRDTLVLGIVKATFGTKTTIPSYCAGCNESKDVEIDLNEDIKVTSLTDPINDRVFTVKGKKHEYTVQLPLGSVQKEILLNPDKTVAEQNTMLLENCVLKIDNSPVLSKIQVQQLGMVDRKAISAAINDRVVGPKFDDVIITCPDCEGEVRVPVNFGTLFQF